MLFLKRVLERVYKHHIKGSWDTVWIIDGDEGTSKSTLGLTITDWWCNKHNGTIKKEDINKLCLDKLQFAETLKDSKQYEMIVYDEAGELSNRRAMSTFNFLITQAYQVIRGDNLFTILIVPSVFDLDPFFTKRRARGLIHLDQRGRFRFYNRNKLRKLISLNVDKKIKSVYRVRPLFLDTFPIYKGILKEGYDQKKKEHMANIRKNLFIKMKEMDGNSPSPRDDLISRMGEKLNTQQIADIVGLSQRRVQEIIKAQREMRGET